MKRNKKGFTLVELVIVIAVIAILAGVMIAIFSGVIKRANENAELQQVKNDELKQKAEDVLTKLDNANWFSWEDFENSLAAKLTEAYKNSTAAQLTTEQIQDAVKKALEDYAKNNASENSQLTEAQVKVIIENAISEAKLGGVTEAQVRTIVNTAVGSINTVSKADIQRIVDAATSKGLTAEQVAKVINDAGLATNAQLENVSAKVQSAVDAINALKPVTKKDVSDAIIDLVPVTYTINTAEDLADALARVKSFSTLNFTSEYTVPTGGVVITLPESDDRVLTIKGIELSQLTVNAPSATVYLATDAGNVLVTATAENSFHVVKTVETLTVNKGRVVVEENAVVTTLKAAPSLKATVKVVIEEEGTVKNLNAEYQKNGDETRDYIEVVNNGTVVEAQLTLTSTPTGEEVTTNVKVTNGANAKGTEPTEVAISENLPAEDVKLSVKEEGQSDEDASRIYYVKDVETLMTSIDAAEAGDTVVFLNDITLTIDGTYITDKYGVSLVKSITIDGNGHSITSGSGLDRVFDVSDVTEDITVTLQNIDVVGPTATTYPSGYTRGISFYGNTGKVVFNLINGNVSASYYAINVAGGNNGNVTVNVTDSSFVAGWAAINVWSKTTINVKDSTFRGYNDKTFNQAGWNTFATVVLNKDDGPNASSKGSVLNFENTTIIAEETTGNAQWVVDLRNTNITASFNNCTFEQNGTSTCDNHDAILVFNANTNIVASNCTFKKDGTVLTFDELVESYVTIYSYDALTTSTVIVNGVDILAD